MKTLTITEAEKLIKKYLKERPNKIRHSILVSKFAYKIAKKIKNKHPELKIDLHEIRILGLLHDIGRGVSERWRYHSFEGGKLLRKLGYPEYASKIEKHDPTHEVAKFLKIKGDFIPKLLEEKILVYADSHYKDDKFVSPAERSKIGLASIREKSTELLEHVRGYKKRQSRIIKE